MPTERRERNNRSRIVFALFFLASLTLFFFCLRLRASSSNGGGASPSDDSLYSSLRASIQAHVKGKLAAYEYPREVEFIDALPMTTTGKVIRKDLKAKHIAEHGGKQQQQQ